MSERSTIGLGSSRSVLSAAERADPRGHSIHIGLAVTWAFLQSITNAGEGIAWGMLLGITVLRMPKIWWCLALPFRDPLWWALVAWFSWTSLTSAWGPDLGDAAPSAIPDRWLLTPLMLWPVMSRPAIVLGAMAAGGVAHAMAALVLSRQDGGWQTYHLVRGLSSLGMMQWQFVAALVLCASGARWTYGCARMACVVAGAACACGVWILAVRTAIAATVIGCSFALFRPRPKRLRHGPWSVRLAAGVAVSLAAAWMVSRSPAWDRIERSLDGIAVLESRGSDGTALASLSGGRLILARAACDIGMQHPILGGGAGWFKARLPQWVLVQVARDPRARSELGSLLNGSIGNAHNAVLQCWVDGGLLSATLLVIVLAGLARRLWIQSGSSPTAAAALAVFVIVLANVPGGIVTTKAPGALIAACLSISWLGAHASRVSAVG